MNEIPRPLTPADCDLRDFPFMPVDIVRLFGSSFHARATDGEWRAGMTLWLKSFHQVPAASLADDDIELARAAEFGTQVKAWRKVREGALRGWVKASDDRLYHPVVAEKALEAWVEKLRQRKSSAAGNAKRHGTEFDPHRFEIAIEAAIGMLAALNPQSRVLRAGTPAGKEKSSHRDDESVPVGANSVPGGTEKRSQETGKGREELSSLRSDGAAPPPESPAFIGLETNRKGETFVVTEAQVIQFTELYPSVDVEQQLRSMRGWLLANPGKRKTAGGMLRFITSWLSKEQDKGPRNGTSSSNGSRKPGASRNHEAHLEGLARLVDDEDRRPEIVS